MDTFKTIWNHSVKCTEPKTAFYQYATGRFSDLPSRKSVKKAIKKGLLLLNGESVESSRHLKDGDIISLVSAEIKTTGKFDLSIPVIYEDDDIAVLNKPAGYSVSGHHKQSIQNALWKNLAPSTSSDRIEPHAVHRLDKSTRGLLLIAKTRTAQVGLGRQFELRQVRKSYHALCVGEIPIEGNIHVDIDGLQASTQWLRQSVIQDKFSEHLSLVQLFPNTGRRHQLRKHMSCLGHHILGDSRYSPEESSLRRKGLFLAATGIEFTHPRSLEKMCFHIPVPHKFIYRLEYAEKRVCDHLRK